MLTSLHIDARWNTLGEIDLTLGPVLLFLHPDQLAPLTATLAAIVHSRDEIAPPPRFIPAPTAVVPALLVGRSDNGGVGIAICVAMHQALGSVTLSPREARRLLDALNWASLNHPVAAHAAAEVA